MWKEIELIQVDKEKFESMENELGALKAIENDKFIRFIEFVDRLSDSRAKTNTKYAINTFIQYDLERMQEIERKLNS